MATLREKYQSLLAGVQLDDIKVAADGSVRFANPEVAKAIATIQKDPSIVLEPGEAGVTVNVLLCGIKINGKRCKPTTEDAGGLLPG